MVLSGLGMGGVALSAQPAISQNGVVNAASLIPPSFAGGSIGRGALFTISGVRLGSSSGHTAVTLTKNGAVSQVEVLKVADRRIIAWMPVSAPLGSALLMVSTGGESSKPFAVNVSEFNPGLFGRNGEGWGPALADNIEKSGARFANSLSRPAHPGQRVALAATGLAATKNVTVILGNRTIQSSLMKSPEREREEITVTIPSDAPVGCWVPVYILAAPARASNVVTLTIGSTTPCRAAPVPMDSSQRIGVVALSRARLKTLEKTTRPDQAETILDDARISFIDSGKDPKLTPLRLLPPEGTCTGYTASFQANADLATSITSIVSPEGRGLDAGSSLALSRGAQTKSIGEAFETPGRYRARLGSSGVPKRKEAPPLFLFPGEYLLKGPGGKDVGAFTANFTLVPSLEWTDRDAIPVVDRSHGVTVHWKDESASDLVLIIARNIDQIATTIGMTICAVRAEAGQFTIPPALLANIPASSDSPAGSYDELAVAALASRGPVHASGLNSGIVMMVSLSQRFVHYR